MKKTKKQPETDESGIVQATRKAITVGPKLLVKVSKSQFKGFSNFIKTQGVIGLAIGLILGSTVNTLVRSLIDNVIMPPVGLLLGSAEGIKGLSITLGKTAGGKVAVLNYGIFLNDFVNFLVIAFTVYFIVRLFRLDKTDTDKPKSKK
jgi:large conductance mechanosensitive channel